ncbi:MAG: DEAD/DEAH box helicase, partial [Clostridia bacterium]|nr:DEAD/DEAH box helicase [Clostridia bacterium]
MRFSGLRVADVAQNPWLSEESPVAGEVWESFEKLTEYRLYQDLRRGWRVVQPNLEEVGLVRVDYLSLEEIAKNEKIWQEIPLLQKLSPEGRAHILRAILDYFRKKGAIDAPILRKEELDSLYRRVQQNLNEFWGLDPDVDELLPSPGLSVGSRTFLARLLGKTLELRTDIERGKILEDVLEVLVRYDFLRQEQTCDGTRYYRLN